jgi:RimJ/RimL family protein N-acetyltransferase
LKLRSWQPRDLAPYAALSADPEVMAFYPAPQTPAQAQASIEHWLRHEALYGFSNWAIELAASGEGIGECIGFCGLTVPVRRTLPFMPCVEIGWRLARAHWGRGYATEAAHAAVAIGFDRFGLNQIVSFTATVNLRSQAVMQRLGMRRDVPGEFDHPALPPGHPLERHVLYRLDRNDRRHDRRCP